MFITSLAAGSELSRDADVDDALGEWDDAEDELYAARLSRWESRQHLVTAADVVPGQVRFACPMLMQGHQDMHTTLALTSFGHAWSCNLYDYV